MGQPAIVITAKHRANNNINNNNNNNLSPPALKHYHYPPSTSPSTGHQCGLWSPVFTSSPHPLCLDIKPVVISLSLSGSPCLVWSLTANRCLQFLPPGQFIPNSP